MKKKTYICGIFYAEQKGEESSYLNIKGKSSSSQFQEVYWKNILSFFATAFRTNPEASLVLFSNSKPSSLIAAHVLEKIGVEIINLDYHHQPPKGHWHAWQSTFYIIDCLHYLQKVVNKNDCIYFMDIDCLILKNLNSLNKVLMNDGYLNYAMDYPVDFKIHGVSREDMKKSFSQIYEKTEEYPTYFGGEIYGVYGSERISTLYTEASKAWKMTVLDKSITFNTEEHLFTFVFWKMNQQHNNAKQFIKRIWTDASNFRNVNDSDLNLSIWHVPAEKRKGLARISKEVLNDGSNFWTVEPERFNNYLGRFVSIPKRNFNRVLTESSKILIKKVINKES